MRILRWGVAPQTPEASAYSRAGIARAKTPWREARYCVVDLELSGLDPRVDEIVSYGAVPIESGRVLAGAASYGLVRPERPVPERSVLVHGIRTVDLAAAPPVGEAIVPLLAAMTGKVLVAHFANVERAFLGAALRPLGLWLRKPVLDTELLGRLWMSERGDAGPAWLSLGELVSALGLPEHRPHHALGDALTAAQAFIALATHLDALHPETVGESRARCRIGYARCCPGRDRLPSQATDASADSGVAGKKDAFASDCTPRSAPAPEQPRYLVSVLARISGSCLDQVDVTFWTTFTETVSVSSTRLLRSPSRGPVICR